MFQNNTQLHEWADYERDVHLSPTHGHRGGYVTFDFRNGLGKVSILTRKDFIANPDYSEGDITSKSILVWYVGEPKQSLPGRSLIETRALLEEALITYKHNRGKPENQVTTVEFVDNFNGISTPNTLV